MTSTAQLRKIKKPVIERRRRERINDCLQILKTLILEAEKKEPSRYSKMEKADILEMTVKHLKSLHHVLLESPTPRSQCSPPSSPPTTPQYRQLDENNNVITTQHTESHSPNSFVVGVGDNSTERVINKELRKFNEGYDVCAMEVDHFLSTKTVTDLHSFSNKTNLDSNRSFLRSVTSEQSHQSVGFGDSASKHLVYLTKNAEQEIKTSSPKCTSTKIVNENTFSNRHVSGNDSCSFSSTHLNTFPNVTTNSFCPKVESSGKSLEQYSSFVPFSVPASTFDKSVPLKDVKSFTGNIFSSGSVGSSTLFTVVSPDSTYMNNAAPCLISSTRQSVIPLYATVPISCPVNILPVAALNAQCHDMSRDVTVNNIRCDSLPIQSITSVKKYEHSMNRESSFTTLLKCGSPQLGDDFPRSFNNNNHYSSPTSTQVLFYKASEGEVNNGRVACSSRGGGSPQTPATGSNTSSITVATDADMWRPWSFQ